MLNFESILQYFIGVFYFYHGLNGFFQFQKLPSVTENMAQFLKNIEETKFILPVVKVIEVVSGGLLLINQAKHFAIFLLLPIVFGITISQVLFNFEKGKGIAFWTAIPFLFFLYLNLDFLILLLNGRS